MKIMICLVNKIRSFLVILLITYFSVADAQKKLSLDDCIEIAMNESFEAFRSKNMFKERVLDFKDYKYSLLPKFGVSSDAISYSRSIREFWNSTDKVFEPNESKRLSSNASMSISQPFKYTGGVFKISSYLAGSKDYNSDLNDGLNFRSNPVYFSYVQNFSDIYKYRWRARIDPLKFEEAKKRFVEDGEAVKLKTVKFYFNLLDAEMNVKITELNKSSSDTLFSLGKEKFKAGKIAPDSYYKLELNMNNADIEFSRAKIQFKNAKMELCDFLEFDYNTDIVCNMPKDLPLAEVVLDDALALAIANNPDKAMLYTKLMEAKRAISNAKMSRVNMEFNVGMGYNKSAFEVGDAYKDLQNSQQVSLTLNIPIVDWGDRRRVIKKARLREEIAHRDLKKQESRIGLIVKNSVNEFNFKSKEVAAAAKSDTIAQMAYDVTKKKFIYGIVNVIDINDSYRSLQSAKRGYVSSLRNYWAYYYTIRKICLYDFVNQKPLEAF